MSAKRAHLVGDDASPPRGNDADDGDRSVHMLSFAGAKQTHAMADGIHVDDHSVGAYTDPDQRSSFDCQDCGSSVDSAVDSVVRDNVRRALETYQRPADRLPTGLVYSETMLAHFDSHSRHPECPNRLIVMEQVLRQAGLLQRMRRLDFSPALNEDLLLVHSQEHINHVESLRQNEYRELHRSDLNSKSAFANEGTVDAALMAAGGVIRACEAVMKGEVANAFCLVRPPGHHALGAELGGFCFFNSVAVAASVATTRLGCKRVLIVDWDVHHGNGIQDTFLQSDKVLYLSVHRWHNGTFYPPGPQGGPGVVGSGPGLGFNINIGWNERADFGPYGDAELMAAFNYVVVPAAQAFDPDLVLVACGFDAGVGDPLGGCTITPAGFAQMLHSLLGLAQGRVVLALEGGYSLATLSSSGLVLAQVLMGLPPLALASNVAAPCEEGLAAIKATIEAHARLDVEFSKRWAKMISLPTAVAPAPPAPLVVGAVPASVPQLPPFRLSVSQLTSRARSASTATPSLQPSRARSSSVLSAAANIAETAAAAPPPTPEEAKAFVESIRNALPNPDVEEFQETMRRYRDGSATMADAVACFGRIFKGHTDLLVELNRFLPDEMKLPL